MIELLALAAMQPADAEPEALRARVARQPEVVREFVARRAGCNHWAGEEPYDNERRARIARALGELRCGTIAGEEIFLRRHFASRPDTLALLEETRDLSGW
jgi:hypothetical protein